MLKITIDKWTLICNEGNKRNYIAIPPTNKDRIDIITFDKMIQGYNYNVDAIIVIIKEGKINKVIQA